MKKLVVAEYQYLDTGPYSLDDLVKMCNEEFDKFKKAYKGPTPIESFQLEVEYDDESAQLCMTLYRRETNKEMLTREEGERVGLINKEMLEAKKGFEMRTSRRKKEMKMMDFDYLRFVRLSTKFKDVL